MAKAWGVAALGVALLAGTATVALSSHQAESAGGAATRLVIPGVASDSAPTRTPTRTPTPAGPVAQTPTNVPTLPPSGVPLHYEAFAGGPVSHFTKGAICSLEHPFVLEGDALPVFINFVGAFIPTSSTHGNYTFTTEVLDGDCVDSSEGTYDVTFYLFGEGDIIMTGPTTRVCGGVTVFSDITESRIAIREASGLVCP